LILLIGLPHAGVSIRGKPVPQYLEFPPLTRYVERVPFSWPVFALLALLILVVVRPFVRRICKGFSESPPSPKRRRAFPWWGWVGVIGGVITWLLAWTRFPWFTRWQAYTFSPQWFSYIIVINALTFRRSGHCMLVDRPRYFLRLFPLSSAFWWFFEYLNRFVQNWHYEGIGELGRLEYFIFATLPFSTVLPAVLGTRDFLATFPRLTSGVTHFLPIRMRSQCATAVGVALLSCAGLMGIGIWPNLLFPLLWLAPLGLLVSVQILSREPTAFEGVPQGDWSEVVRLAIAASVCGFFWEMWNFYSQAKWIYLVPYVNRFHVFEMPLLGYAGYLPFGLECATVAQIFLDKNKLDKRR
ncbi:MAG: hypothetical protein ACUVWX_13550, partial [Kiritimatiellia bacterium]